MDPKNILPYRKLLRNIRWIAIGANSLGAVLTIVYSTFIDPVPKGTSAVTSSSFQDLFPTIVGTTLLMFVGSFMIRFSERYHPKWYERIRAGESPAGMPDAARREVLNYPAFSALITFVMWTLAAIYFGYYPNHNWNGLIRLLGVGGILTTALTYFGIDAFWRPLVPVFIPGGEVSRTKAFRIHIFGRMTIVFVLAGLYPTIMLALTIFFHARNIIGAPNPQVVFNNMILAMIFVLFISLTIGITLTYLIARSVVDPLMSLQHAMARIEVSDLNVHVPVLANDELGYVSERFNHMVEGLRHGELLRNLLNLYVSPEVAREALEHGVDLGGEMIECTVLFSDLRGFTSLSEQMSPSDLIMLLNRYMTRMVEVIVLHGGMVNKFGGDSLLAVFGTPLNPLPNHASAAVQTALGMRAALVEFNCEQVEVRGPQLQCGIAVATGKVVAGNIGGRERIEYTVIGDTVNLAARLQGMSRELHHDILLNVEAHALANLETKLDALEMPSFTIRGKNEPVTIYAL